VFNGTEFQFGKVEEFWRWRWLQPSVNTLKATELFLKIVKVLNFILCVFYHNKKSKKKILMGRSFLVFQGNFFSRYC
jgi:hypothetical protein